MQTIFVSCHKTFYPFHFPDFPDDMLPPDMHEHEEYVVREEITQNNLIQDKGMDANLIRFIAIFNLVQIDGAFECMAGNCKL